jgi:cytochrome P450
VSFVLSKEGSMVEHGRRGPSPPTYPGAKALREVVKDPLALTARIAAMNSPVVATRFGPLRPWFVCDAELARQVLVTDGDSYERDWPLRRIAKEAGGLTLFSTSGREWRNRRRLLQPQFARSHIDELVNVMAATILDEVDRWQAATTVDLQERAAKLTLRVTAQAMVGVDLASHELGPLLATKFESIVSWMNYRLYHLTAPPAHSPDSSEPATGQRSLAAQSGGRSAGGRTATIR